MTTQVAAGSELDVLVAELVMGWTPDGKGGWYIVGGLSNGYHFFHGEPITSFSTSWEGAGLVIERMRELDWWLRVETWGSDRQEGRTRARFVKHGGNWHDQPRFIVAPTAPEAICLAALAALA